MYKHVGVSSDDASRHKCRDLSDSPGHATWDCFYVYTCWCVFRRCVESQMQRPEWFTWSCFFSFVTRGFSPRVESQMQRPKWLTWSCWTVLLSHSAMRSCYCTCKCNSCNLTRRVAAEMPRAGARNLVWLQTMRRITNAETWAIRLVMLLQFCYAWLQYSRWVTNAET